jgi:hypothetical protein
MIKIWQSEWDGRPPAPSVASGTTRRGSAVAKAHAHSGAHSRPRSSHDFPRHPRFDAIRHEAEEQLRGVSKRSRKGGPVSQPFSCNAQLPADFVPLRQVAPGDGRDRGDCHARCNAPMSSRDLICLLGDVGWPDRRLRRRSAHEDSTLAVVGSITSRNLEPRFTLALQDQDIRRRPFPARRRPRLAASHVRRRRAVNSLNFRAFCPADFGFCAR